MKIDLTEREMKITYNKLNYYMNQREHFKDMGGHVKNDDKDVIQIMHKLIKAINSFEN